MSLLAFWKQQREGESPYLHHVSIVCSDLILLCVSSAFFVHNKVPSKPSPPRILCDCCLQALYLYRWRWACSHPWVLMGVAQLFHLTAGLILARNLLLAALSWDRLAAFRDPILYQCLPHTRRAITANAGSYLVLGSSGSAKGTNLGKLPYF